MEKDLRKENLVSPTALLERNLFPSAAVWASVREGMGGHNRQITDELDCPFD